MGYDIFYNKLNAMKSYIYIAIFCLSGTNLYAQIEIPTVDYRIDNILYWQRLIEGGYFVPGPIRKVPPAVYVGSQINSPFVALTNSQDILIDGTIGYTESENSVSINPNRASRALNSNNSTLLDGSNGRVSEFATFNQGVNWTGSVNPFGSIGFADPAAAISNDGRFYVGFVHNSGQGVAVSTNQGASWNTYTVATPSGLLLDKNHLWVDRSIASQYVNQVYTAWTDFFGSNHKRIVFSRSTDGGVTWSNGMNISQASASDGHDQGVNIHSGPDGKVYAVWAIYDAGTLQDERAIGFTKSTDGGATFPDPAVRIVDNIKGIRLTGAGKGIRTNSFPVMAVDNSFGPNRGTIYVVWSNIGIPGTNFGDDVDIYLIKSTDEGASWTSPQKINTSNAGDKKKHFFPWITCDQTTGKLHIIYYDDRNVSSTECETWMSSSFDGGISWEDYKISDVSFTPVPVFGNYFGDYLGVSANNDVIYPVWTDNRDNGRALAYTSPLISSDFCPNDLTIQNITLPVNATYKYRAVNSISVAGSNTSFVMQGNGTTGARASMIAGNAITLSPKTSIETGAVLTILPGPCSSPLLRSFMGSSDEFTKLNIHPKEFEIDSRINIYPNPVNDIIYLELSKELQNRPNISYVLSDLRGTVILKGFVTKNLGTVNTGKLAGGGYLISFYEDGRFIETKKIIKR